MKKRNFLSCLLIIAIVLATISPTVLFAAEDIAQDEQVYDETYTEETEEYVEETPEAYDWTIETNELKKWPQGPRVEAEGATVMDLDTGAFLYSKNAEAKLYPASITKIMTVLLAEYSNEPIDVLKTVTMLLIHDLVEIDAGDTYAYDEEAKKTQRERELKGAERIFGMLPPDQGEKLRSLWDEFEAGETPEARFAHTMDNLQPAMLNVVNNGVSWKEHGIAMSQIMKRNAHTAEGSQVLWDYAYENFFKKNIDAGNIIDDSDKEN